MAGSVKLFWLLFPRLNGWCLNTGSSKTQRPRVEATEDDDAAKLIGRCLVIIYVAVSEDVTTSIIVLSDGTVH